MNTMKKLITLTAALFLTITFSCNKTDVSPPRSVELKLGVEKNFNVLLFDEVHAAEKEPTDPKHFHLHLFDKDYLTDGSQALIESNLAFGLAELQEDEVILPGSPTFSRDEEIPWSYCINDGTTMTGFFLDYYVTDKLLNHKPALDAFKLWFEKVVVDWMNLNNLAPKVKPYKAGNYWIKVIGSVI